MREGTRKLKATVRQIATGIEQAALSVARQARDAWHTHRQRLADDPAYGAAFAGVVMAACELLTADPRLLAVIAAVTTAYITISRAARTSTWEPESDWPWEPGTHN